MVKKSIVAVIILILCGLIFLTRYNNSKTPDQAKGGLKINSWSSGLGSVNNTDLDKTKFSYWINLTNENETSTFIKSIQPSVSETIKSKIISKNIVVIVNKEIKPTETIQIKGEIIVNTKSLTKSDIIKLEPFITDVKVSTIETISLNQ